MSSEYISTCYVTCYLCFKKYVMCYNMYGAIATHMIFDLNAKLCVLRRGLEDLKWLIFLVHLKYF